MSAVPRTFVNLYVLLSDAVLALSTLTVTVRKLGAPTALTVTYAAGESGIKFAIGTVAIGQGDSYDVEVTSTGAILDTSRITATIGLAP